MKLQASKSSDIALIMNIIEDAQGYLKELGIDQWQDGYPNKEQLELDIKNEDSYIVMNELNNIMGTTVFTTVKEPTYQNIEGKWLTAQNSKYGVIHRLAVGNAYRKLGLAKFVFSECEMRLKEMGIKSMRIDTHNENKGMQHLLICSNYIYCGIIYLENGDERLGYEKIIY